MAAPLHQNFRTTSMNPQAGGQHMVASESRGVSAQPERQESFIQTTFKRDVAKAREILTELLKKATTLLQENTKQPGNQKDTQRLKLEKGLEELFAVLDQIEVNLRLAIQWHSQSSDSRKQVGLPIASKKTDEAQIPSGRCILLQDYMRVVKVQIQAAKDLHDLITDTENRLTRSGSVQSASAPPIVSTPSGNKPPIH